MEPMQPPMGFFLFSSVFRLSLEKQDFWNIFRYVRSRSYRTKYPTFQGSPSPHSHSHAHSFSLTSLNGTANTRIHTHAGHSTRGIASRGAGAGAGLEERMMTLGQFLNKNKKDYPVSTPYSLTTHLCISCCAQIEQREL